jgi:DNA-binding response OmpR family regulator
MTHTDSEQSISELLRVAERVKASPRQDRGFEAFTKTAEEQPEAGSKQALKSVLIVDEKYLTETLKLILQIIGYHVETASSGVHALKKTLGKHYDLIIMEVNLPDSNGSEMAQIIRNMDKKAKIILMTGDEYFEETLRNAPGAVEDVILKPFAPEELIKTTRRVLEPRNAKLPKA